jgi:CheY-like chemotaxis protein
MLESNSIIQLLPVLRRFARAVMLDAKLGDACIEKMLNQVLQGEGRKDGVSQEVAAFSLLDRQFADLELPSAALHRRALLLTAMEGFPDADVAKILQIATQDVMQLLISAETDLTKSLATDVLIIEDEVLIARLLGKIVTNLGHTVVGYATTHTETLQKLGEHTPGLVLADVNLADGSLGSDAARDIWEKHPNMPIIFITAYPDLLLSGEKSEPDFLIPKPFRPEYVQAVVSQALMRTSRNT